jgi:DMSO/TMAO reductase YedYZ heme-binding membrane subunit
MTISTLNDSLKIQVLSIHRALVPKKSAIEKAFFTLELGLLAVYIGGGYVIFHSDMETQFKLYEVGTKFGIISLWLFLLTLLPGILTRLRTLTYLVPPLTLFRRHFGITMFLTAFIHFGFTTSLPIIANDVTPELPIAPLFGMAAFWLLFPLWLTSNDFSQNRMGRYWKWLHRVSYLSLLLIFLHVAFFRKAWAIPVFIMLVAEIASWIAVWRRK